MIISFLYKRSNATVSYFCDMNYQIPLNKMKQEKGITRREALKRMGLLMAGSAASITGVSTLTACDKVQRKRIILYFTGTGNCLYVARQLADKETEILRASLKWSNKAGIISKPTKPGLFIPSMGTCLPIWYGTSSSGRS